MEKEEHKEVYGKNLKYFIQFKVVNERNLNAINENIFNSAVMLLYL
jgi:hypothetical protein